MPGRMDNAEEALKRDSALFVYPGGEWELFRPWTERNRIDFKGRTGFIKLAISQGVPVVPVVAHGGHDTRIILTRGGAAAKSLGLKRYRLDGLPITWGAFGPGIGWLPNMPFPAKITLEMLDPIDWSHHGPEAASDTKVLDACYREITSEMQSCLTRLARENPYPVASRIKGGLRDGVKAAWQASLPRAWRPKHKPQPRKEARRGPKKTRR